MNQSLTTALNKAMVEKAVANKTYVQFAFTKKHFTNLESAPKHCLK